VSNLHPHQRPSRCGRKGGLRSHQNERREAMAKQVIGDAPKAGHDCRTCDPRKPASLCNGCRAIWMEVAQA